MASTLLFFTFVAIFTILSIRYIMLGLLSANPQSNAFHQIPPQAGRLSTLIGLVLGPLLVSSPFSSRSRCYLRLSVYFFGLAVGSLTGVVAGLIVPIFSSSWRKNIQWLVARTFYHLVSPIIGWEFVVEGEERLDACYLGQSHVLVGNHQSMVDILYLGRIFPKTCVVMAKKELKYVPLLGQYMALSRAVFVDRQKRGSGFQMFQKVEADMKKYKLNLFIFPEGTRSNASTPSLLPFKKGAFHLSVQANLPVIPIVCETYSAIYQPKRSTFESGKVIIKVLEPIHPKEGQSADELCASVREKMLEALIELSERPGSISSQLTKDHNHK